ncbi:GGDEF domain-containing protein [Sphingomonas oligophenolica]|uniref:diguanylate cyclase n=1 Tax=Sphingomonas oligophenolica TaxID=301154 RepID=A0A502C1B4_9SPHN|nr:GGDEF domain-containing protein [Sphingomonas oligophenolica]TPG06573.1 GGDEF domain-containing protein [Sphingomonas oligophenolica]
MFMRNRPNASASTVLAEPAEGIGYDVLRFLNEQGLEHTPINYALIWRLKADRRSLTAIAVDSILMDGRMLTQADVDRITAAEAKRGNAVDSAEDRDREALRHQTLRLADLTADATAQSSEFGRDLSTGLFHLAGGPDSIEKIVTAMVQRTRGIEAQLTAASQEIEELREEVETIRDDAHRDGLTGLLNRRGVLQELEPRRRSAAGVLAMCDVDHFKSINDRFGHGVGDRVLKGVAASLSESMGVHVVARWGGEEFLIIADGVDTIQSTRLLEQACQDLAARSFKLRETDEPLGTVTVSIGAVSLIGRSVEDAIEAADRMLYTAKREGRNRVVIDKTSGPAA